MAWQSILPEVIVKGFKECRLSNAMDGTDDDTLWNMAVKRMGILGGECEEDEGNDCEDGYSDTGWW